MRKYLVLFLNKIYSIIAEWLGKQNIYSIFKACSMDVNSTELISKYKITAAGIDRC